MSSKRFPGKVLEPLHGQPMIVYMARRAARARRLDGVVIVTSTDPSDDALAEVAHAAGLPIFRGALEDVLQRYADAAREHGASEIVRLTGDCPLIDPAVIDAVIDARRTANADYAGNVDPPTYPDGLDVECFTRAALERACGEAHRKSEREHVTLWMRSEATGLNRAKHAAPVDLSHLRLTVDYPDDLHLLTALLAQLPDHGQFDVFDILRVLTARPELLDMNIHARNEGLAKSLAEDRSLQP